MIHNATTTTVHPGVVPQRNHRALAGARERRRQRRVNGRVKASSSNIHGNKVATAADAAVRARSGACDDFHMRVFLFCCCLF
jgi:hypothetical protein